jgi:hypothetical protein
VVWCLAALLALQACATPGNQVEEVAGQQSAAADATTAPEPPAPEAPPPGTQHFNADEFGRAMGGALAGATFGAGVSYLTVYSLGGPGLVSIIGTPIVTTGAVVGAVVGLAKATSHR